MKKFLSKEDLSLVAPTVQKWVKEAWNKGEEVPYGIVYLVEPTRPLTDKEIITVKELCEKYGWNNDKKMS